MDGLEVRQGLYDLSEKGGFVREDLAEVFGDNGIVCAQTGELVVGPAKEQVEHRARKERVHGRSLVLELRDVCVAFALGMEVELAGRHVAGVVFDFDAVRGERCELGVDEVPVAGGVGFFGPQKLVADVQHLLVAQGVLDLAVDLFVVAPDFNAADGHRVVFRFAAVVGNLDGHVEAELVLDRGDGAALAERFAVGDADFVPLPYGDAVNLRGNRVLEGDAGKCRVQDAVVVQADFKVQVRVADSGTACEGERVALVEFCPRLQGHVVFLGGVLLGFDQVVKPAKAALVRKSPGFAAFALEQHELAVTEGGDAEFFDLAVFGGVYYPAFFHVGGVVESGVVARAAVFAKARSQVGVAVEGVVDGARFFGRGFGLHGSLCGHAVFVGEGVHCLFVTFFRHGGKGKP